MAGLTVKLVNLHNAIRALAEYRLADWDRDPLIIRRWSQLTEEN